jgi:hypothetical protein
MDVTAAERARWLAELAEALDQAQRLVWNLGDAAAPSPEVMELYGRLDAVRAEVQIMRFKREIGASQALNALWPELPRAPSREGSD